MREDVRAFAAGFARCLKYTWAQLFASVLHSSTLCICGEQRS